MNSTKWILHVGFNLYPYKFMPNFVPIATNQRHSSSISSYFSPPILSQRWQFLSFSLSLSFLQPWISISSFDSHSRGTIEFLDKGPRDGRTSAPIYLRSGDRACWTGCAPKLKLYPLRNCGHLFRGQRGNKSNLSWVSPRFITFPVLRQMTPRSSYGFT